MAEPRQWEPFGNPERRQRKMDRIDHLAPDVRQVVHDFGWATVKTFLDNGVTKAKAMRALIHIVLYEHSVDYRSRKEPPHPVQKR